MQTIGDFFNSLAVKAGINAENEHLKNILSAPDLAKITVPDDLVRAIDSGLLNIEAAKNGHPEIKRKYFADAYDGLDAVIHALSVDTDVMDLIKAEKTTAKKIQLLTEKLKEKRQPDGAEAATLKGKINELQNSLRDITEEKATYVKQYEQKLRDIQMASLLEGMFGGYKTIYDELPADVKKISMRAIIDKQLQDNNAVLSIGENGTLQLVGKDGTNVFGSDHRQLTPQTFMDKSFASILKVSDASRNGNQPPNTAVKIFPSGNNAANGKEGAPNTANSEHLSQFTKNQLQNLEQLQPVKMI